MKFSLALVALCCLAYASAQPGVGLPGAVGISDAGGNIASTVGATFGAIGTTSNAGTGSFTDSVPMPGVPAPTSGLGTTSIPGTSLEAGSDTKQVSGLIGADPLIDSSTSNNLNNLAAANNGFGSDSNGFSETLVVQSLGGGGIKPIMRSREYVAQANPSDDAALAALKQVDYNDPDMQNMLAQLAQVKAHIINSQNWIVKVREIIKAYNGKIAQVSGNLLTDRANAERLRKVILARHSMLVQKELQAKLAQIKQIEAQKAQQMANVYGQAKSFEALKKQLTGQIAGYQNQINSLQ